jgi:flagellar biosynthesis anti-sigma factor FlgM
MMKIYGNRFPENKEISHITQKVINTAGQDGSPEAGRMKPSDKVEISLKGKEVAELKSALNQIPEVRIDRVKEIKEAIEAGTYRIDPLKIAEKMCKEL